MKRIIAVFFTLVCTAAIAQPGYYWVKFKDKNNNIFSISNPQQFLSQKSIERRHKQGIALNETDLPISENYIASVTPFVTDVVHRLKWFNTLVVTINSQSDINSIKALPFVDSVDIIQKFLPRAAYNRNKFEEVYPDHDQSIVYPNIYGAAYHQANMLSVDILHQMGFKGQGIIVSSMDNGFHNVNVAAALDSIRPNILATWDFVHNNANVYDSGEHGTTTFSCLAGNVPGKFLGTAPNANYLLLQSEDDDNEWILEEYHWAAAAEWADSAGAQIFTTSLGYTDFPSDTTNNPGNHTYSDLDGSKTIIARAGNVAFGKGILVLNSAGNEGEKPWHYISTPADGDSIMAVGAVDSTETITKFSGRGPAANGKIKPDVCAQGASSAVITSNNFITTSNGTSFSCPIMAGAAASLWSAFPDKTNREIYDAIMLSCDRFWKPDNDYGYGIPNFYTAYLLLKTNYDGNVIKISDDVTIFPNPFYNELNVSLYSAEAKTRKVEIFDLQGKLVLSKNVYMRNESFDIITLNEARGLPVGEYVLRLDGDKKYTHRIMKLQP